MESGFSENLDDQDIRSRVSRPEGGAMTRHEMPAWVAHVLTPPEVLAAAVERRVNDPALLSGDEEEPTYADFLRAE
jgi:hypothetical protein